MTMVDESDDHHQQEEALLPQQRQAQKVQRRKTASSSRAMKLLQSRPMGVMMVTNDGQDYNHQRMVEKADIHGIFFPWHRAYKIWWSLTVVGAIFTLFFGPFQIAFQHEPGTFNGLGDMVEFFLTSIFVIDIGVTCNLAIYKNELIVFERTRIMQEYVFRGYFWVDVIGVFPFEYFALMLTGHLHETGREALLCSLFRMLRFVRLHRVRQLSEILQYNARVSLLWFTLVRNLTAVVALTHIEACFMYFLARLRGFDETTWLGPLVLNMTGFRRYVIALYWVRIEQE